MKNILFTGGGGAGAEAIWRLLSTKYSVFFADACVDAIDENIPTAQRISIPFANDASFIDELARACKAKDIDLIVPGVDEELLLLCEDRDKALPEVFLPQLGFVKTMLDKHECAKAILNAGLTGPLTRSVELAREIGYPLIIKPRSGRGSRGVSLLRSEKETEAYIVFYNASPDKLLAQEYCEGDEYTILALGNKDGILKAVIPVKIAEKKGITLRAHTEANMFIIDYVRKFHDAFKPHGIYNIQCILTRDNIVMPFEVNPRISTTFCLGLASGFDPFDDAQLLESDKIFIPEVSYSLKRNWSNTIAISK